MQASRAGSMLAGCPRNSPPRPHLLLRRSARGARAGRLVPQLLGLPQRLCCRCLDSSKPLLQRHGLGDGAAGGRRGGGAEERACRGGGRASAAAGRRLKRDLAEAVAVAAPVPPRGRWLRL
jgi:hypothetical protein